MIEPREKIRSYVQRMLANKADREPLSDDSRLVTDGRLDSLDIVEMIAFLESSFGVDFSQFEFDALRFDSIDSIVALIPSLRKQRDA